MDCYCVCHSPHSSRAACSHCYPLVLFCGSRTWDNQQLTDELMAHLNELFKGRFHVVQGGAKGGDDQAWLAARRLNVPVQTMKADWQQHGRSAGFLRNAAMLEKGPQYVVALWDGRSRGTGHTIDLAVNRYRIPTMIVKSE